MKKFAVVYIVLLWLAVICDGLAVNAVLTSSDFVALFFVLSVSFKVIALVFGVVFAVLSAVGGGVPSYSFLLVCKLLLVPFFVVNFGIGVLLIGGLLNPFLIMSVFIVVPVMVVCTYLFLLPFSVATLSAFLRREEKYKIKGNILWLILLFVFVLDVVSSVVLLCKSKK